MLGLHVSFPIMFFFRGICPVMGLLHHMVVLFLVFKKKSLYCSPLWLYQFAFPPTVQEGSLLSTASPEFIVYRFFDDGHSDHCEVIPYCNFDLRFSNNEQCWASFHVFITYLYVFFGEMSVGILLLMFQYIL